MNMPNSDYWTELSENADFRRLRAHIVLHLDGRYGVLVFSKVGSQRYKFNTRREAQIFAAPFDGGPVPPERRPVRGFAR